MLMLNKLCQVLYENLTCSFSPLLEEAPSVEDTFRMVLTNCRREIVPMR